MMPVTATCSVLLVRHAHIALAGRFCGQIDPPLSEQGRLQLPKLAAQLAKHPLTHIFSSDLLRARQTAEFVAARSNLEVESLPELREIGFGEWEGLNWDEVSERFPEHAKRWMEKYPKLAAPGGEEFADFRSRVQGALAEVARRSAGGRVVVVTHGGVIRTLLLDALDLPETALAGFECEYASCVEICACEGRWRLAK